MIFLHHPLGFRDYNYTGLELDEFHDKVSGFLLSHDRNGSSVDSLFLIIIQSCQLELPGAMFVNFCNEKINSHCPTPPLEKEYFATYESIALVLEKKLLNLTLTDCNASSFVFAFG